MDKSEGGHVVSKFVQMIRDQNAAGKVACLGLDPVIGRMPLDYLGGPHHCVLTFCKAIIDATKGLVCAYKPNSSFFEGITADGLTMLEDLTAYIHYVAPDVPVVYDGKRTDIGKSNGGYVESAFGRHRINADAITVNPYFGGEALGPFLAQTDKGVIVLCKTSNPGAAELQDLLVRTSPGLQRLLTGDVGSPTEVPLYQVVAHNFATKWNDNRNVCLVAGATYPAELVAIRQIVGDDVPLLLPGIGTQGAEVGPTVTAAAGTSGRGLMMISNSSAALYASSGPDFAEATAAAVLEMNIEAAAVLAAA